MTEQELLVRRMAAERGLNPDLAVSVWQQESNKSTNTGLRGPDLSRGRGNAIGPWQVVPYYHPEFPIEGSFEEQTAYGLDYLKKVGPAKYYGTGQAPPGQPTTEQYVNQVLSRVPGQTVDAAQIAPGPAYQGGSVQPVSTQGSPVQYPEPPMPPMPVQMGGFNPDQMMGMMKHPLFNPSPQDKIRHGLGIMANVLGGGKNVLGGALGANYANDPARWMMAMKMYELQQDNARSRSEWEQRNYERQVMMHEREKGQAYLRSLPSTDQTIAGIIGPQEYAKLQAKQRFETPKVPEVKTIKGPQGQEMSTTYNPARGTWEPVTPTGGFQEPQMAPAQQVTSANTLTDNYRLESAGMAEVLDRYNDVREIDPETATGAQDWNLMVSFGKSLDPGNAVQLGEAEAVQAMAAGRTQWGNTARKVLAGEGLTVEERKNLLEELSRRAERIAGNAQSTWTQHAARASRAGLNPHDVVPAMPPGYTPLPGQGGHTGGQGGYNLSVGQTVELPNGTRVRRTK